MHEFVEEVAGRHEGDGGAYGGGQIRVDRPHDCPENRPCRQGEDRCTGEGERGLDVVLVANDHATRASGEGPGVEAPVAAPRMNSMVKELLR